MTHLSKHKRSLKGKPQPKDSVRLSPEDYKRWWFDRILAKSVVTPTGCLIWQGNIDAKGYGSTSYRGVTTRIHRKAFLLITGMELEEGQMVCHKCDVRRCWNMEHLFVGNAAINNRDCGNKGRHHNGVKTHCKRGHEFTVENTYLKVTPTTVMRACLQCQKIRADSPRYKEKARESRRRRAALKRSQVTV